MTRAIGAFYYSLLILTFHFSGDKTCDQKLTRNLSPLQNQKPNAGPEVCLSWLGWQGESFSSSSWMSMCVMCVLVLQHCLRRKLWYNGNLICLTMLCSSLQSPSERNFQCIGLVCTPTYYFTLEVKIISKFHHFSLRLRSYLVECFR